MIGCIFRLDGSYTPACPGCNLPYLLIYLIYLCCFGYYYLVFAWLPRSPMDSRPFVLRDSTILDCRVFYFICCYAFLETLLFL